MPIDMLRLKLSFFGAVKFDPRSDKWLRICMFQEHLCQMNFNLMIVVGFIILLINDKFK